jgi:hypothetical protein
MPYMLPNIAGEHDVGRMGGRSVIGGGESTQTYYARVPDRLGAEEAVKKRINATPDVIVTAIAPVSASSFEGMNVKPGNVAQWIGRVP